MKGGIWEFLVCLPILSFCDDGRALVSLNSNNGCRREAEAERTDEDSEAAGMSMCCSGLLVRLPVHLRLCAHGSRLDACTATVMWNASVCLESCRPKIFTPFNFFFNISRGIYSCCFI